MAKIKATHGAVYIVVQLQDTAFLDMLRYDNCTPGSEAESSKIAAVLRDGDKQWVVLKRFVPAPTSDAAPTYARWESFGIKIENQTFENYYDARRVADIRQQYQASLATK